MANKKTLVLGASDNPSRYSYLAIKALQEKGHEITAIGKRMGTVGSTTILTAPPPISDLDTVTLYLNPANQKQYYDYIFSLAPKRIIFNPGAENRELAALSAQNGIAPMEACTLVLLSTGQY
jgi:predicted CoA-binding protein